MGAGVLAAALRKNTSIRELHIKGNELGDEGVKALCEALAERPAGAPRARPLLCSALRCSALLCAALLCGSMCSLFHLPYVEARMRFMHV